MCPRTFEPPAHGARKTCSRACSNELKRRKMLADPPSKRPEVRRKISEAKKRKAALEPPRRDRLGRLVGEGGSDDEREARTGAQRALEGLVPESRPAYLTETGHRYLYRHVALGFSAAEIAREEGKSASTVSAGIRRAGARVVEEMSPEGAFYGEMGRFENGRDRAMCHLCGRWFKSVGVHVAQRHGMTADEYREAFSLMKGTALVSEEFSEERSEQQKRFANERFFEASRELRETLTFEERSRIAKKAGPRSLEYKRSAAHAEGVERLIEGHARAREDGRITYEKTEARLEASRANMTKARGALEAQMRDPAWRVRFARRVSEARLRGSAGLLSGLRGERLRVGLSQQELGARAGLSASSISLYEGMRGGASPAALAALTAALAVPEERLLSPPRR